MRILRSIYATGAALSAALYAWPVLAEEAGKEEGLPQFDTSLFPEQLFWLAISFVILYVLMSKIALPGVKQTQDKRQSMIAADLEAATKANEDAKAMIAQYEKALADARSKAQSTVDGIVTQASREASEQQAKQHQELTKRTRDAETKITAARDAAMKEVKASAADLAQSVIEKIIGVKVKV